MPDDVAAYLLLAIDLLLVAAVLALPVLAVRWLVGRSRPVPGGARWADQGVAPGERVLRRCDDCGVRWQGLPGRDVGVTSLRVRRWKRRRTRRAQADTPAWAARQGWSRCPSCLSANVRTSRAQRSTG